MTQTSNDEPPALHLNLPKRGVWTSPVLIQCWLAAHSVIGGLNSSDVCDVSCLLDNQLSDVPPPPACCLSVATCALEADLPPHTNGQMPCPGVPIRCFESDAHCRNTVQNRRNQPEKSSNGLPADLLAFAQSVFPSPPRPHSRPPPFAPSPPPPPPPRLLQCCDTAAMGAGAGGIDCAVTPLTVSCRCEAALTPIDQEMQAQTAMLYSSM